VRVLLSLGILGVSLGCLAQEPALPLRPQPQEIIQLLHELEAPTSPIHAIFERSLKLAADEQFYADPQAASATIIQIDAALAKLPPQPAAEREAIAQARRQYNLLGAPLPFIPLAESLFAPNETPRINTNYGSATILLLFPGTCSSCVEMARGLRSALFRDSEQNVHLYGLMATPIPVKAAPGAQPLPVDPTSPAAILRGTPTLLIAQQTLAQFGATAYPFVIATDSHGIVRYVGPAPQIPLMPGSFVDQLAAHIARLWPPDTQKPARK
jgi:hypothetical protein